MEFYNGIQCVTADDLDGIILSKSLCQSVSRGKITRVRRGCFETPALYAVESLPYKYKVEVYKRFPDWNAQQKAQPLLDSIAIDAKAAIFFSEYTTSDGRHLPENRQKELTNNASILNMFRSLLEKSDSMRYKTSHKKEPRGEFWKTAAEALPRIADKYPNTLPNNARRLQDKYNHYLKEGYGVFISGNMGNANAGKVVTEEQKSMLLTLYKAGNNLDYEQIAKMYNAVAGKMGWPEISASGAAAALKKFTTDAYAGRHGARDFRNKMEMQVSRKRPEAAMLMWVLDGWTAEFYYRTEESFVNRMTLEVILDPCCNYPIGYAISSHENKQLIIDALRNALNHTRELFGARYMPYQMQYDNYAKASLTPIYEATTKHATPAAVGNAKSKVIEPYFKHLNKTYAQMFRNWSGFGVKSRGDKQPSAEWLNRNKYNFPDEQGVIEQITTMIRMERAAKIEQYMKMWSRTDDEHRLPMSDEQYLLNYGYETGHRNAIENCGIRPTIEGVKREYDCFDLDFRRHTDIRWIVKYDPEDLSHALAVSEDGVYRFMLEEKYKQPMALAERKEGDAAQLHRVLEHRKAMELDIAQKVSRADEIAMAVFDHNSELDNTLAKSIITSSCGQHKDLVSAKRLKEAKVVKAIAIEAEETESSVRNQKRRSMAVEEDEWETTNRFDIY